MRHFHLKIILLLLFITMLSTVWAQKKDGVTIHGTENSTRPIVITGARFTYPLIQKWIEEYRQLNPATPIIVEPRGTTDPASYDILVEAYEQDESVRKLRDYEYVGRYAILPVANSRSQFTAYYKDKGLNHQLLTQLYFHDVLSEKEKEQVIKFPYLVYNRLQKAGAPIVFTSYFGYAQKDIRGKAIAGSDEHLLKALVRDSLGVSYLPLTLIYDHISGKTIDGISVLPVDLNGNGKVSDDEKFYSSLSTVVDKLDEIPEKDINNIPIGYIHLSVAKANTRPEAIEFLKWILANGQKELAAYGYLPPRSDKANSEVFLSNQAN